MKPFTFYAVNTNSDMKRRNLISPLVLLSGLFFVVFLVSCSKEGAQGPAGPAGTSGDSVFYSDWLDVSYKADTIHTSGGGIDTIGYYATINVPKLTLALLNTADVKVYINSQDATNPVVFSLPYYSATSGLYIQASTSVQTIDLYSNANVGTFLSNSGVKYQQYRYMIVPGNTHARKVDSVNWSDYAAVKAYLGLKD
ncbi:hypothetical protein SAMN05421788_10271 [Filimonas lacunae]|uniref:Collagen triple helix repeat-containing protein n=2 Tax=Filimonas lacunae TaxID=477680 RepID=A0A1N7MZX0_9BACT|nr:hypothetical protein SAMN05421788_10271 [Filimonas lacunae]